MEEFPEGYFHSPKVLDVQEEDDDTEEQEIKHKKEKAQMCKVIALSSMGIHPITNVSALNTKTKLKIIDLVKVLFEKDDEEIKRDFNEIVISDILSEETDYTGYPIFFVKR